MRLARRGSLLYCSDRGAYDRGDIIGIHYGHNHEQQLGKLVSVFLATGRYQLAVTSHCGARQDYLKAGEFEHQHPSSLVHNVTSTAVVMTAD
jgi:hypothetical protein